MLYFFLPIKRLSCLKKLLERSKLISLTKSSALSALMRSGILTAHNCAYQVCRNQNGVVETGEGRLNINGKPHAPMSYHGEMHLKSQEIGKHPCY